MLVVGLIDIQHKGFFFFFFFFSKVATILVICKPSDRETRVKIDFACLQQLSEGVSHNIEGKKVSALFLS